MLENNSKHKKDMKKNTKKKGSLGFLFASEYLFCDELGMWSNKPSTKTISSSEYTYVIEEFDQRHNRSLFPITT